MANLSNKEVIILNIVQNEDFAIIVEELEALAHAQGLDVLKLSLDGTNERELLIRKARAEGASRLTDTFKRYLNNLKSKAKQGDR